MKIMIVVTHLLGTGHLARARVLGLAFVAAGHDVTLVSGGVPPAHVAHSGYSHLQLPPIRSDGVNFTRLLDQDSNPVTETLLEQRRSMLKDCLAATQPDVVITELFPFGRRVLTDEFLCLLRAAGDLAQRPLMCASVRDILAPPSKPSKADAAHAILREFYDAVLVHSDQAVTPLEVSWPVTDDLASLLHYTGYVAPLPAGPHPGHAAAGEILVTTGGGSVGQHLFDTALAAAATSPETTWRLLVGGAQAEYRIQALQSSAPGNCKIQPASPDFRQMLYHAKASVSLCGYNTALDVLQAGTPAVFVPFDDGGEVEQTLRANALSRLPGIAVLGSGQLDPETLLSAVRQVSIAPRRPPEIIGTDGAHRCVEIVTRLMQERSR